MILYPNIEGLKYFLYLSTIDREITYLPQEIREIIWNFSEKKAYMECKISNIIMKLYLSYNIPYIVNLHP